MLYSESVTTFQITIDNHAIPHAIAPKKFKERLYKLPLQNLNHLVDSNKLEMFRVSCLQNLPLASHKLQLKKLYYSIQEIESIFNLMHLNNNVNSLQDNS